MNSLRLNKNEFFLIALSLIVFVSATTIALKGISLRHYFFNLDTPLLQEKVGVLESLQGNARRVSFGRNTFETIQNQAPLYNLDTIFTGSQSSATLKLDDESEIKLLPNSMIKLEFTKELSFTGIERVPTIQIISGNFEKPKNIKKLFIKTDEDTIEIKHQTSEIPEIIKAQPKLAPPPLPVAMPIQEIPSANLLTPPPFVPKSIADAVNEQKQEEAMQTPPPVVVAPAVVPTTVTIIHPTAQSLVLFSALEVLDGKLLQVELESNQETEKLELSVKKTSPQKKLVETKQVEFSQNKATIPIKIIEPGTYSLEIQGTKTTFIVPTEVSDKIEYKDYKISGALIKNNLGSGEFNQDINVQLEWAPVPNAIYYDFKIYAKDWSTQPRSLKQPQILLGTNSFKYFPFQYHVTALLKNGFKTKIFNSEVDFAFLPPPLSTPKDKAIVKEERVLLTWKKIQFSKKYKVELSKDKDDFKKPYLTKEVTENFALFYNLKPDTYFWRVISLNNSIESTPSKPLEFTKTIPQP